MSFARMKGTDSDMGQENPSPYGSEEGRSDAVPPAPATPPRGPRPAMDRLTKQRLIIGGIVLGVLLVIGISLWILLAALSNKPEAGNPAATAPASRGPLPADIEAKDYRVGDCFSDFDSKASKAHAVDCTAPHSAQLGAVFNYKANDGFPGTNALRDKGRDVCRTVLLNEASRKYSNLLQQNVYPSSDSWNRGDRRVDCFIVVDSGNTLKESILQK